jgi:hypothetical protein
MITHQTIKIKIVESIPGSPHLSALNIYPYHCYEVNEPVLLIGPNVPMIAQGVTIIGIEWDDTCRSQWLIGDNGLRYRPDRVLSWLEEVSE